MLIHQRTCQPCSQHHHTIDLHNYPWSNKRSRTVLVINSLIALPVFLLNNGVHQKTPPKYSSKSRHSEGQEKVLISLLETSLASSAIAENILDCLTSAMVLSKLSLLSRGFYRHRGLEEQIWLPDAFNKPKLFCVNEQMNLYTVPISISKQSSFRQTGSFESSGAMRRHTDRVVHD